jgi:MoxR-like ATPase
LEGVPGLAKTKTVTALGAAIKGATSRIQFTPDLLPSDIIGTEIYRPQTGEFTTRTGPVFANLVLADEINRAPSKVQSALLEAMAEGNVTIGTNRFTLPKPFMVLATQNPIEQSGTYELPEAQLDRFLMKLKVSYPTFDEEMEILEKVTHSTSSDDSQIVGVISNEELLQESVAASEVYIDKRIDAYIVKLVQTTRNPAEIKLEGVIAWGASPRASIALKKCAKALAYLRNRHYVLPEDVKEIAPDILRHRILLSFEAEGEGTTSDNVINELLRKVSIP